MHQGVAEIAVDAHAGQAGIMMVEHAPLLLGFICRYSHQTFSCIACAATGRITGTFTNDFDLTQMGMGVVPASGKMVEFPASTNQISFNGDKVSRFHNTETGPDAGLPGMLKALGMPAGQ